MSSRQVQGLQQATMNHLQDMGDIKDYKSLMKLSLLINDLKGNSNISLIISLQLDIDL